MARTARHNLAAWDTVEIVTGAFEAFTTDEPFDATLAFTAFHWIEPEARYDRLARLLRSGGLLVVADSRMTGGEDADSFFHESGADYVSVLGERASAPGAPDLVSLCGEIDESGVFEHLATRNYLWHVTYAAPAYLELLDSFPWHATLEPADREELYARLQRRIEARGTITATFEAVLDVARLS
jgi:SAM-dependent methyltransferase